MPEGYNRSQACTNLPVQLSVLAQIGTKPSTPKSLLFMLIRVLSAGKTYIDRLQLIYTRSYAALRAADLDWIVGPGYSPGG